MQKSALCRSRRELSNEYLLAKIGVDTAEDQLLKVWGYGVSTPRPRPLRGQPAQSIPLRFNSLTPTGLKGKLASLEDFISMQNEELAAQRQEIESLP